MGEVFKTSNTRLVDKVIRSISLNVDEANKLSDTIHKKDLGIKEIRYCDRTDSTRLNNINKWDKVNTFNVISETDRVTVLVYKEDFTVDFNIYPEISKLDVEYKIGLIIKVLCMGDTDQGIIDNYLGNTAEELRKNGTIKT